MEPEASAEVSLGDLDRWQAAAAATRAGPPGCWEIGGSVALTASSDAPASRWTRGGPEEHAFVGSFLGRLDGGRWTAFTYDLSPADRPGEPAELDLPLFPTIGHIDPGVVRRTNPSEDGTRVEVGSGEAVNLLNEVLDELNPATATAYVERDQARGDVVLYEDIPVSRASRSDVVTVTTRFAGGGAASEVRAVFPRRWRAGEWPLRIGVYDAQLQVAVDPRGLPTVDALSFGVGALGMTFGYAQTLTVTRAEPCTGP
ncbi:MAG: hypothetical protein ABMA64_31860 [Myxococcota bacterium]